MSVTEAKGYYKPFIYPEAFDFYKRQSQLHWIIDEIKLHEDVRDYHNNLEMVENTPNGGKDAKNLLSQLFRFFTQADVDVGQAYMDILIPYFKNEEVRMMLSTFCQMESIHAEAYAALLDTVGMDEIEYKAFKEYEEMAMKHDYISKFNANSMQEVAKAIAGFSGFTEGMQLFSTFAILLNFQRFGVMNGMGQVVAASIKDETCHADGMTWLFRKFIEEHPRIWNDNLRKEIYDIARQMVELEDKFIDMAFDVCQDNIKGLTRDECKQYVRFICDYRLMNFGLKPNFGILENPLPWISEQLNLYTHGNFFETTEMSYTKGGLTGSWNDVWNAS